MGTLALGALSPYPPGRQRPAMNREEPHLGLDSDRGVVRPEGPTQSELLTLRARCAAAEQRLRVTRDRIALERTSFLAKAGALLASNLDYRYTLAQVARLAVPVLADCCAAELVNERGEVESLELAHVDPTKVAAARTIREFYGSD